jgi:uncharacterized membrane protein
MLELLALILIVILFVNNRTAFKRIDQMEKHIAMLSERVGHLASSGAAAPAPELAESEAPERMAITEATALTQEVPAEAMAEAGVDDQAASEAPAGEASLQPAASTSAPAPAGRSESLENYLGARWAVWAGGLALALGGLFLVRYSIESGLLGPGVRLSIAALFGLLLVAGGEIVRRKALPQAAALYDNAMIPGILTAAGTLSLFGAIYAAHGIYEFIGPTLAFLLLALVAFATLGLSLLHGQALAGLGLAASLATPALVSSTSPNPWTLFSFLTVSLVATAAAARLKTWRVVPVLANAGLGLWAIVYILFSDGVELAPVTLALIALIATALLIWPAGAFEADRAADALSWRNLGRAFIRKPAGMWLSVSLAVFFPALTIVAVGVAADLNPLFAMAALIAALAAAGAARRGAAWPAFVATTGAILGLGLNAAATTDLVRGFDTGLGGDTPLPGLDGQSMAITLGLGAVFLLCGLAFIRRRGAFDAVLSTFWAALTAAVPITVASISFVQYGVYARDWTHGLYGLALGLVLLGATEFFARAGLATTLRRGLDLLIAGSFVAFAFSLHMLTDDIVTTILLPVLGFAYLMANRVRPWSGLPWMMVAALVCVLVRIAIDPTLVGPEHLATTPLFNALLPGYGIPAILAILSAYELRNWPGFRVRNALQGLASLLGLLAVAILIRHAMNGGVLDDSVPTLGEQSIYTLLITGLSGILMTLDLKSPSPVFRYGSMVAGVLSMANVLVLHLFALNPFFTGESTGAWPLVNLLLIGYLLPGLAYAGLAFYARDKRPLTYVAALAVCGAVLGFAWVTLSVRRFWHGEFITSWKGFEQAETYTYSVAWLAIGVGLLALGTKFDARSLRLASAVLVFISVGKAFLIDMSHLEGVLRALSFIGLGVVLIGIGLFYQKILTSRKTRPTVTAEENG